MKISEYTVYGFMVLMTARIIDISTCILPVLIILKLLKVINYTWVKLLIPLWFSLTCWAITVILKFIFKLIRRRNEKNIN